MQKASSLNQFTEKELLTEIINLKKQKCRL